MKILSKITAILLCLLFVFAVSGCKKETDPTKMVVANVGGEKIFRSDIEAGYESMVSMYTQYGMPVDEKDESQATELKNSVLDSLVSEKILDLKAKELGFDKLTKEEEDEITKSITDSLQAYKDQIKSQVEEEAKTDTSIKVDEEITTRYNDALSQAGYTEEAYIKYAQEQMRKQKIQEKLIQSVKDQVTVSEEEIKKWYDDNLKTQQDAIKADATQYSTYESEGIALFAPEGIVRVQQILIKVPDDKSSAAQSLTEKTDAMNMLRPYLDAIKPKAEEVLAKVTAKEDFGTLMDTYNEDTGLKEEPAKSEGYMVIPGNTEYLQEFTDAALALKNDGDTSGLIETIYGYHILKRIGTVTPGIVPLENVKDKAKEKALTEKQNSEWTKKQEAWKKEVKVDYYRNVMFDPIATPKASASPSASASASVSPSATAS